MLNAWVLCVRKAFPNGEWVLLVALVVQIAIFSTIAQNFFTQENFFEVARFSVELGLLAVALTPVIVTGGIDLSVGSMMGLAAVVFGGAVKDLHLPVAVAVMLALATGCAGGGLNAALISRLKLPPLIVTLGTYSMFGDRGRHHARRCELYGFSRFVSISRAGIFRRRGAGAGADFHSCCHCLRDSAASFGDRAWALCYRLLERPARAMRGYPWRSGLAWFICFRVWYRAWRPSFMWRIWGRRNRRRVRDMSWMQSRPLCWVEPRFWRTGNAVGHVVRAVFLSVLQNGLHLAALPSELTGVLTGVLLVLIIGLDRWRHHGDNIGAMRFLLRRMMK